jgi:putative membrane-bound dehydrogenase-like protein
MQSIASLILVVAFCSAVHAQDPAKKSAAVRGPLSPAEEAATFRLPPGLKAELVASEPDVESPVAIAFDEDGRLWVVEMQDYPNGPPPGKPAEGRIRVLEDKYGRGHYGNAKTFAEHLLFCHGLLPWRGGVLVTMAPQILFMKDTDGDGKADLREVLYEGFATENPQLRVNHPVLGLDNLVYVSNGLRGGKIRRPARPGDQPADINGRDFAFDPLAPGRFHAVSGMSQYGQAFDDWGHRFVCNNHEHLRHVVLDDPYIRRHPFLAVPGVVQDVSELTPGPLSSGGKVYPLSHNWTTSNLHAGRFTSACSVFLYRDHLLGEGFFGSAFTCEPAGNLVHQEVLRPQGATFASRPAREGAEFLASPDDWFRPVFLADGPDGALYVVDMYRAVIEHPEFMPPELKTRRDLVLGKNRGRIWRVVPADDRRSVGPTDAGSTKTGSPHLRDASSAELVKVLEDQSSWRRETARRLLLERQDPSAVEPLRKLAAGSGNPSARIAAAWLLHRQKALTDDIVRDFLRDQHPGVRENGLQLAERRMPSSKSLVPMVLGSADDPDPRVRFQAALTLGEMDNDAVLPPLSRVAARDAADPWTRLAVASAVPTRAGELLRLLLSGRRSSDAASVAAHLRLIQELAALVGARQDRAEVAALLALFVPLSGTSSEPLEVACCNGLADGMARRGQRLSDYLDSLVQAGAVQDPARFRQWMADLFRRTATAAADNHLRLQNRLEAIRLLAHVPWESARPVLSRLLQEGSVSELRLAAVKALAAQPAAESAKTLIEGWAGYTPGLKREVVEAMVQRPERALVLLKEIEAGRVKSIDLDPARVQQLLHYGRAEVRDQAARLLQRQSASDRKKTLDSYRAAATQKGDALRGREIFKKNCATCHQVAGIGVEVGPDISDLGRTKTKDQLLFDIIDPNAAIDSNFINYVVTTKNGKVLTGILAAETGSSITLRRAENQTDMILRQDIDQLQSTGQSLMPEGLEKTISIPEMADLLSFLKNWRYLDGSVPLSNG